MRFSSKTLSVAAILILTVLVSSAAWAQSAVRIQKNVVTPSTPTPSNARYVAITPPAENYAASCIWVLDTVTGQVQAYRIFFQSIGGTSYSYFVRLPEFKEAVPPGQVPINQ